MQLQKENRQLKAGFYEIMELAYSVVNKNCSKEPNFSFFDSNGSKCTKNHQEPEYFKECFFTLMKNFTQAKKPQPNNHE